MNRRCLSVVLLIACSGPAIAQPAAGPATDAAYGALPNLVANPGFEMDWMHNRVTVNTRFLLLEQSDWGYAQADGHPDYWMVGETSRLDTKTVKFGKSSLRLQGNASQVIYLLGETDPRDGGAFYNNFRPVAVELSRHVKPRPLRFGAWCKTKAAETAPSLTVVLEYVGGKDRIISRTHGVAFAKGTHDWEYREVVIPVAADLGAPHAAVLRLSFQGKGFAWFDGVLGEETVAADEPNLLPNGGFERLQNDAPAGWSAPVLWSWARREYYRFTGWSHEKGKMAGGSAVSFGRNGGRALQFTLLPGDNLAVKSGTIRLHQKEARVLEVSVWVKAEDLRWLEIMAQDEKGAWLPQQDFSGCMGTDEHYRNRVAGIGSHDWEFVRKHFVPSRPVREMTLWLCARGFDGKQMARNVVGTVWFDDVVLRERGTPGAELAKRGVGIATPVKAVESPFRILDIDFGERLWGDNAMKVRVDSPTGKAMPIEQKYVLIDPSGAKQDVHGQARITGKDPVEITMPYRLTNLAGDWQQHFRLNGRYPMRFGTPPSAISLRLAGSYFYPDEKLEMGINLNITRASLKEVARCRVMFLHPKMEKVLFDSKDVAQSLWTPDQDRPRFLKEGFVDARNLLMVSVPAAGFPVHKHRHPVRDCKVQVALFDRQNKLIGHGASERFGFLEKPAAAELPDRIEKTEVVEGGILHVNGKPYTFNCFPASATDLGGISRMINFPKSHKILAIPFPKDLIITPKDEASWKQKIQAFVNGKKSDPKLFGWYFAHDGETTFWFDRWKDMAGSQKKAAAWVRAIDGKHVILSAHWLFGHEGLTPATGAHFGFLDVIDVEPGLTWTPDSKGVRRAAGRPVSVVAGLECYYFQPIQLLRWRMYEALRQGANGVGICPSGMLASKPEIVSFLRGLHGELQGLEPILTGKAPATATKVDHDEDHRVTLWERQHGKTRYLVAMVGERTPLTKGGQVGLRLPVAAQRVEVMFEGRTLNVQGGVIRDSFGTPYTVHVYRVEP